MLLDTSYINGILVSSKGIIMNEVQKKLSKHLPKMAVEYVFRHAILCRNLIVFETQDEIDVAERLIADIRRAMPEAKLVLRNSAVHYIEAVSKDRI